MSDYATYLQIGNDIQPIPPARTVEKLIPGMYSTKWDPNKDLLIFSEMKTTHDELIDLPGTAYEEVMQDLDYFLTEDCMGRFARVRLLHKLNILLYGVPGGGKTCIVNRVALKVIEHGGIVLFNPDPRSIKKIFDVLNKLQPETRVLIIFEELDQLVTRYSDENFLHILDGEIQKHNAMFIATTNYINKVPKRIRRPGRFPVRLEVGLPSLEARAFYVNLKLKDTEFSNDSELVKHIAESTEGFTIDQLKEVIRQFYCMKKKLNIVLDDLCREFEIAARKGSADDASTNDDDWAECDDDEEAEGLVGLGK